MFKPPGPLARKSDISRLQHCPIRSVRHQPTSGSPARERTARTPPMRLRAEQLSVEAHSVDRDDGAGGELNLVARSVADRLSEALHQPPLIQNHPAGNG